MDLPHHHHASLQKNLWCNNAQPLKFSAAAATVCHPIRSFTLVGAIGFVDGGGWSWGPCNRRWCSFDISGLLLAHLPFFIRVTEDDDLIITGRP
jgi:hypothetical protein